MRSFIFTAFALIIGVAAQAQFRLGIFGGIANYQGDLTDHIYQQPRPAFGLTGTWQLSQRLNLRAGLSFGKIAGADSLSSKEELRARNLSFQSRITELSLLAEYHFFNLDQIRWTPYVFGGLAVFKFNPYTIDGSGNTAYLQPLTTEGQGLPGYGGSPYKLTQLSLPFGAGIKYAISERVHLGLEVGLRKTFTDYLDDISTGYADPADLIAGRGQRSADLAWRGDELPGGSATAPEKGFTRGNPNNKDYYYFSGLHLSFRLGEGRDRSGYGCPKVDY